MPVRKISKDKEKALGMDTLAVHSGEAPDYNAGSVIPPIYQTSTFHFPEEFSEAAGKGEVYLYTRHGNPTLKLTAKTVAALEGAEGGRVFSSGMAALSAVFLTYLKPRDEVVALDALYGNTLALLHDLSTGWGVRVKWVSSAESPRVSDFVGPRTKLLVMESPTNPTLRVHDIGAWVRAAHGVDAHLLVDNTFATPVNQNPLRLGADLVMHSATKYLSGHSDVIAGALAGPESILTRVDHMALSLGGTLDPLAAFLLSRGMKTVGLRVRRHNENGAAVAREIPNHPRVEGVSYPGTHSDDEEVLARRQMRGRGGMVSIIVKGGAGGAHRFMQGLKLVHPASSLGGVESLASVPAETSHRQLSQRERERRGIPNGMVRLSLGIEDTADLLADLRAGLSSI